jgi:hypothetical protein
MGKHKKFIKDAYEGKYGTMCQDCKDTILEHYPEFKVGEWVVVPEHGVVRLLMSPLESWKWTFSDADTNHIDHFDDDFIERKATPKEVEEHLIEEAKNRGFVNGAMFISVKTDVTTNSTHKISSGPYFEKRHTNGDYVLYDSRGYVFANGQWAEIIPTMTKEEAEEKLGCKIV